MKSEAPTTPQPPQESFNRPEPAFGWTPYAEQINGRFAMIGFVGLLLLEFLTGQGLLSWLGLK
jgi:Chlorophyll A-B binding protein.